MNNSISKIVFTTGLGSLLEMYDFVIYALFAAILGHLFFPLHNNNLASLMASFGAFAVGFLARPLGSVVFGHFGDRYGRKHILIFTILLMAASSFAIAIIPTYVAIGITATVLIIVLRLLQGFAVGGEFAGAVTFVAEHASNNTRGFMTSWMFFFINMGILLASALSAVLAKFISTADLADWGWRLLFAIGGLLAIIGMYLRQRIYETPLFVAACQRQQLTKIPLKDIFKNNLSALVQGCGITIIASVYAGMILMYMPSYLSVSLHMPLSKALQLNSFSTLLLSLLILVAGKLSDKYGRKPIILFGTIGFIVASCPLFVLLNTGKISLIMLGLAGFAVLGACVLGVFGAILAELFSTATRYTGIAFSYNIPFALLAGTAPLVSLYLIHHSKSLLSPSFYLIACAAISLLFVLLLKDKSKISLEQ